MIRIDYMKGNARPIPLWLWFFALLAISAFSGLLMYLNLYEKGKTTETAVLDLNSLFSQTGPDQASENNGSQQATTKQAPAVEKPHTGFDFYSLLPKMEVLVPEHEVTSRTAKAQLKQSPDEKGAYFLQAGAFKDHQAADRMKAGLALLGIESKIESVKLDSGVWHRVRIGPFNDSRQLNKVRNIMKSNSISSIMVKVNS